MCLLTDRLTDTCGGVLKSGDHGLSPNYPEATVHMKSCVYTFRPPPYVYGTVRFAVSTVPTLAEAACYAPLGTF